MLRDLARLESGPGPVSITAECRRAETLGTALRAQEQCVDPHGES